MNNILSVIAEAAVWLWSQWQVQVLVYHILVNVAVALAVSIWTGQFILAKTAEFLYKKILPLVLVYAVFAIVGDLLEMAWIATATWALLESLLLSDLLDNLKQLGIEKGIPLLRVIPTSFTKERLS